MSFLDALFRNTRATSLATTGTDVDISAADPPSAGQVLVASDAEHAEWQDQSGGGGAGTALELATTGAPVNVDGADPPTAGQALFAIDPTHAAWGDLTAAAVGLLHGAPLWVPPTVAHGNDAEFLATGIPAGWQLWEQSNNAAVTNGGAPDQYTAFTTANVAKYAFHTDRRKSHMAFQVANNNHWYSLSKAISVPTNCLIYANLSTHIKVGAGNTYEFGLNFWADNGSGKPSLANRVALYWDPTNHQWQTVVVVSSTPTSGQSSQSDAEVLLIHKLGTTYRFWLLTYGGKRVYMGSLTHAGTMAHVGYSMLENGGNYPANAVLYSDFFRQLDVSDIPF